MSSMLSPTADTDALLTAIDAAITTGAVMRILYRDEAGSVTARLVAPRGWLLLPCGSITVQAYCTTRADFRQFRVDRMVAAQVAAA